MFYRIETIPLRCLASGGRSAISISRGAMLVYNVTPLKALPLIHDLIFRSLFRLGVKGAEWRCFACTPKAGGWLFEYMQGFMGVKRNRDVEVATLC